MSIEKVVRCDSADCGAVVEPNTGFAVLGNIHKVGSTKESIGVFDCVGGGLVGNNIEDGEVVRALYYCDNCTATIVWREFWGSHEYKTDNNSATGVIYA